MQAQQHPSEAEKPLTREDVLKIIQSQIAQDRINLSNKNLTGANLQALDLTGADFQSSDLTRAGLQAAQLKYSNLEGATLAFADLTDADLENAKLGRVVLHHAHFSGLNLTGVDWGDYVLGDEIIAAKTPGGMRKFILTWWAVQSYRTLTQYLALQGSNLDAARFFYRGMECQRKAEQVSLYLGHLQKIGWFRSVGYWAWLCLMNLTVGYGEKPLRTIFWAIAIILYFAGLYTNYGVIASGFWDSLYFSGVSFTALGYGSWAPEPLGWGRFLGVVESFLGVFTMALFVTLFVRKMTR